MTPEQQAAFAAQMAAEKDWVEAAKKAHRRDQFAAAALTGMLANDAMMRVICEVCADRDHVGQSVAETARNYADALLAELDK